MQGVWQDPTVGRKLTPFPPLKPEASLAERADHVQHWLEHTRGELEAAQREYNEAVWHAAQLLTALVNPDWFREAYPGLSR